MTDRDLDRILDTWFGDGPTVAPDRVLEVATTRIDRQRQRPAWRLLDWRPSTMSTPMRLVAVIGALLVAALAGSLLLTGGGAHPSTPAPATSPTASPIAIVSDGHSLAAGSYVAELQAGRLTFTLPAGWSSPDGDQFDFTLSRAAGPTEDLVKVFTDMRRAAKDVACTETPDLGVAPTTDALLADLAADPNLQTSSAGTVPIAGAEGAAIDLALAPGVLRTCPFSSGQPSVPLVVDSRPGSGSFWGIGPNERIRLVAIQGPRGHNLVVAMDSAASASFDDLTAATMPIVRSFAFEAAPANAPLVTPPPCEDNVAGCVGLLEAGPHGSNAFQPGLTFTSPAGWNNVVDTPTIFKLDPVSGADPYLIVWSKPAIPNGCGPAIKPGLGTKVGDFVSFLTAHPGIQILSSQPVTVGRWSGQAIDLRVKDTWTESCPGLSGPVVQFIVDTDPLAGTPVYGAAGGSRMHVLLLDVNGRTVIVQAYTPDSDAGQTAALEAVQPLIDTFQFAAGS